jgi:malate dehydrogenase (oxaloacetate-decarboxylating)
VISGLGAAGIAVSHSLLEAGATEIITADSRGVVSIEREDYLDGSMHASKRWVAERTNRERRSGSVRDVLEGADLLIGLSAGRLLRGADIARMAPEPMIFAMANPEPEVAPEEAQRYARIVATGRSDYPNQINNVLCFPGLFRGALDHRIRRITEGMKLAAARAIADVIDPGELREDYIIPSVFNRDVAAAVAEAVGREGQLEGMVGARPLSAL